MQKVAEARPLPRVDLQLQLSNGQDCMVPSRYRIHRRPVINELRETVELGSFDVDLQNVDEGVAVMNGENGSPPVLEIEFEYSIGSFKRCMMQLNSV